MLNIPPQFRDFNIMSFDPGTQECGVAVWEIRNRTLVSIFATTLVNQHLSSDRQCSDEVHSGRTHRLERLESAFNHLFQTYRPILVCSESPFFYPGKPSSFGPLVEVVSMLQMAVMDYSPIVPLVTFAPMEVKESFCCTGKAGKEPMREFLLNCPFLVQLLDGTAELLDEHAVDAVAVGYTWYLRSQL